MLSRIQKGSNIYAVFNLSGQNVPLDKVSILMINSNQKHTIGLAPISLEEMNGHYTNMLFDITGKVSLREYVSKNISQEDFRLMLTNLIDTLENFDEYMIDVQQVLLDMDSVFINELDHSIAFLCIALKGTVFNGNLYSFFRIVVENSYVNTAQQEISYFHRVWNVIRSENGFSLQNMRMAMTDSQNTENFQKVQSSMQSQIPAPIVSTETEKIEEPPTITITPEPVQQQPAQVATPVEEEPKKKGIFGFFSSKKEKTSQKSKPSTGFRSGVAGYRSGNKSPQPITPVASPENNPIREQIRQTAETLSETTNAFLGTTVLNAGKQNQNSVTSQSSDKQPISQFENGYDLNPAPKIPAMVGTTLLTKEESSYPPDSVGTTVLNQVVQRQSSVGTTVLKPVVKRTACLIRIKNHERIFINKPMILIGRDLENLDCNVHDNTAVGHQHARIVRNGDNYFIVDLNSRNYTYVNGMMIQSGIETPISDGDMIMLANEEFTFKIV